MLPKENRLERERFKEILSRGKRQRGDSLTLVYQNSQNANSIKLGIIVSKKTEKKASDRNKLKRRIRNILIKEILSDPKTALEGVIIAYPEVKNKKFSELKEEIVKIFQKMF